MYPPLEQVLAQKCPAGQRATGYVSAAYAGGGVVLLDVRTSFFSFFSGVLHCHCHVLHACSSVQSLPGCPS